MRARSLTIAGALMLWAAGCDRGDSENAAPQAADEAREGDEEPEAERPPEAEEASPDLADDLEAGATGHYGAAFSDADAEPMTIADALEQCVDTGEPCKVRGEVKQVCKNRGCWMTLEAPDGVDRVVRVRMLDYGFFVPRNADGAEAIIEGLIEDTETAEARARHYAQDEVKGTELEPRKIEGPEPTYKIMARGIELQTPES